MSSELQNEDISTQISQWQPFKILKNVKRTKKPKFQRNRKRFASMNDSLSTAQQKKQQLKKRKQSGSQTLDEMTPQSAPIQAHFDYQNISLNPSMSQQPTNDLDSQTKIPILQHSMSAPVKETAKPISSFNNCNVNEQNNSSYQQQQAYKVQQQQQQQQHQLQQQQNQNQQQYSNDPFIEDKGIDYFKMDEKMYNNHFYNSLYGNDPCMEGLLDYNDDDLKYCRGLPSPNAKKIINYSEFENNGSMLFQHDESLTSSESGYNNMCNMFV